MTQTTDGLTVGAAASPPDLRDRADRADLAADLAHLQRNVVARRSPLPRPPSNVSIRAGEVCVDIAWSGPSPVQGPPPAPAGPPPAAHHPAAYHLAAYHPAVHHPAPVHAAAPRTDGTAAADRVEPPDDRATEYLTSPGVGVFYHAKEPGAAPFVTVGSIVEPGQQIGILEAMKLMMPVEADRAGRITAVVKGNGEPVEYAEALFALDTDASGG